MSGDDFQVRGGESELDGDLEEEMATTTLPQDSWPGLYEGVVPLQADRKLKREREERIRSVLDNRRGLRLSGRSAAITTAGLAGVLIAFALITGREGRGEQSRGSRAVKTSSIDAAPISPPSTRPARSPQAHPAARARRRAAIRARHEAARRRAQQLALSARADQAAPATEPVAESTPVEESTPASSPSTSPAPAPSAPTSSDPGPPETEFGFER